MIHITDKQTDNIIGFFTHKNVTFNEQIQNLETYQDDFEFTTFGNHKYAHTLADMNRIIIPAEDGGYSEYVINTVRKSRKSSNKVRVKSFASYQMLTVAKVIEPTSLTSYTPSQALGFITNNTEWRPGVVESNATRTFHIENYTDRLSFLKTVANEFDLEIRFRIETDGRRVTGRFIDLLEQVGEWRGREITFGKDLESIERTSEGKIVTKLICLGPEDEDGNRLIVEVEDEDALRRWGRPHPITGELMHLEAVYEPTSDRTEMTEAELRQYGRTELNKRINAVVTYEAEVVDLENVPGMANKKIRFGDTVRIKDEKFNPPLYVEARIFEQRRDIFSKANKKVKLGDFIEYTEEELRAVIDRLSKQLRTKISQADLIEHTYSKVEIDQKDQYVFDEGKSFAEAVGITAEDNAKQFAIEQDSALKIDVEDYADQVADQAEDNAKVYADDVSAQALQQALAESVSKDVYNQKMAEIASDLSEKAGIAYVDGKLQIVDGRIDDLDAEIETKADGSTVYTISEVDNMINNTVSLTQYTTDINGIISDLETQGTQIGQNTEAIGLKADQTTVDALTGTVNSHSAQLLTMADEISAKVSADYVQTAIDDIEIGGRNLLLDTEDEYTHDNSSSSIPLWDIVSPSELKGKTVTLSFELMSSHASNGFYVSVSRRSASTVRQISGQVYESPTEYTRFTYTFTFPDDDEAVRIMVVSRINNFPNNVGTTSVRNLKLEKGNKATDWTPAPEDVEAEISSLSAELSVQAGRIEAKADSTTVNNLSTRLSNAESSIDAIEGEITNKVGLTEFNALDGTVSNLQSTVTQTAKDVQFAFDEIDDMGNKINNATVTISGDGVTVTDGDFNLRDSRSNMLYSASPKRNLLKDHSFELLAIDSSSPSNINVQHNWIEMMNTRMYEESRWQKVGSPKVAVQLGPDNSNALPIFGSQAVVVRNANYVRQYISEDIGSGSTYTISGYFKRQWQWSGLGIPRIEIWHVDGLGNRITRIVNATFDAVSSNYSYTRHSVTFNVPTSFVITDQLEVIVSGGNNHWIQCDGMQMVEGDRASVYQPEDSIWEISKGYIQPSNLQRLLWAGQVYPTASQTIIPDKELDRCVNGWIIEWSEYIVGSGSVDRRWSYTHIPKSMARYNTGSLAVDVPLNGSNPSVIKYLFITNSTITGESSNNSGTSANVVIRGVYEY